MREGEKAETSQVLLSTGSGVHLGVAHVRPSKEKNLNRMFWMLQWRPTRAKVCHRPNREPVEWKDRSKLIQTTCRRVLMVKVTVLHSAS